MSRGAAYLLRKLQRFCLLGEDEKLALTRSVSREHGFAPREDLIHERTAAEGVFVVLQGYAARYKLLPDGRRQIVGILLPGDMCDLRIFLVKKMDHSICALTAVKAALIEPAAVMNLLERYPRLARALLWTTVVEDSITREWVINVGCRTAYERVAHLLCEIFWRMEIVGLVRDNACAFPLTQIELADTLALSSVHVNRTLMEMRRANLLRISSGQLELLDRRALETVSGFDPVYLHLEGLAPAAVSRDSTGEMASHSLPPS